MHEEEPTRPIDEELEEDVEGKMSSSRMMTANWGGSVPVKVADPKLPSAEECQSMNSLISPTVLDVHTVSEEKGNHSTIESQTENR